MESVLLCSSRGRPRLRSGRLGVASSSSQTDSGEAGDSCLGIRGGMVGEYASCGASPQSEGVRDVVCVFGEKYAESRDSMELGSKEKPKGYCSN